MQESRNGGPPPGSEAAQLSRLQAATLEGRGVIGGIANCGRAGLLSAESVRQLNDAYLYRVELLLESASVLQRSARTIRLLAVARQRIGWLKPALRAKELADVS